MARSFCRALAEANPDAFLPDLAMSLNNLSLHQSDLGHRNDALASIAEAFRIYRALAETNPDAISPLSRQVAVRSGHSAYGDGAGGGGARCCG